MVFDITRSNLRQHPRYDSVWAAPTGQVYCNYEKRIIDVTNCKYYNGFCKKIKFSWWGICDIEYDFKQLIWECFNDLIPNNHIVKTTASNKQIVCLEYLTCFKIPS